VTAPNTCSDGRSAEGFDSGIAKVETDVGIAGGGEMAPPGSLQAAWPADLRSTVFRSKHQPVRP
jgi:hypothetical protein